MASSSFVVASFVLTSPLGCSLERIGFKRALIRATPARATIKQTIVTHIDFDFIKGWRDWWGKLKWC
jgi:hypothetical protein